MKITHRISILLLLLSGYFSANSQKVTLDSLLATRKTIVETDKIRIGFELKLADAYLWLQLDSGISCTDRAIFLANKISDSTDLADAYCKKAYLLLQQGNRKEATICADNAFTLYTNLKVETGIAYTNLILGLLKEDPLKMDYYSKSLSIFKLTHNIDGLARTNFCIGMYFRDKDLDTSIIYYREAINLFEQENNTAWISSSHIYQGQSYYYFSEYKKSTHEIEEGLNPSLQYGNLYNVANAYSTLGNIYNSLSDFSKGLDYYFKGLKLSEKIGCKDFESGISGCIGLVYYQLNKNDDALIYLKKGLSLAKDQNNYEYQIFDYQSIAYIYIRQNKFQNALEQFMLALTISEQSNNLYRMNECYGSIAECYLKMGDFSNVFKYLNLSNELNKSLNTTTQQSLNLLTYARALLKSPISVLEKEGINTGTRIETARTILLLLVKNASKNNELEFLRDAYWELNEVYEIENNTKLSLNYYKKYIETRDSIFNKDKINHITAIQIDYETEKKEQKIVLLQKERAFRDVEILKQKSTRNAFIGGFILIFMLAGITYNRYLFKSKSNKIIEQSLNDLKNTQGRILENEKLASMGKFTVGVAQEMKDPVDQIQKCIDDNNVLLSAIKIDISEINKSDKIDQLKINFQSIHQLGKQTDKIIKNILLESRKVLNEK